MMKSILVSELCANIDVAKSASSLGQYKLEGKQSIRHKADRDLLINSQIEKKSE